MSSVAIKSFGCRANQAEAFAWAEKLKAVGVEPDGDAGEAGVVIVNSCTLTSRADRDVLKFIRKAHQENPGARIIVTGCLAERAAEELRGTEGVALVLSNEDKEAVVERALELAGLSGKTAGKCGPARDTDENAGPRAGAREASGAPDHEFRARAIIKIQDGCEMRCAYCVIPSVRGRNRSVPPERVLFCLRDFAARGFGEVVLTGIHLSSYGEDLEPRRTLASLLRDAAGIMGPGWLRLSSLDPRKTDDELVALAAGDPGIAQHFHLSLQHASESVLRRMGRAGNRESYMHILEGLRRRSPEAALGADVIVGFPGETDEEFGVLRDFLESSPLTYFHVFSFSPRKGTPAADRPPVADHVVTERSIALRRVSARKNLEFRSSLVGRTVRGIAISRAAAGGDGSGTAEVLTNNYIKVAASGPAVKRKSLVEVTVTAVGPRLTEGRLVTSAPWDR